MIDIFCCSLSDRFFFLFAKQKALPDAISLGSGYFAIYSILRLEAILPSPFMCVFIVTFATILAVMMWCVVSAATLKSNGYGLESLLTGHYDKRSVPWKEGPIC